MPPVSTGDDNLLHSVNLTQTENPSPEGLFLLIAL